LSARGAAPTGLRVNDIGQRPDDKFGCAGRHLADSRA